MDDDDFETMWIEADTAIAARRLRPADIGVVALDLVRGVCAAITNTVELAQNLVMSHANWQCDREQFAQDAALEIEQMTNGEE